MHEGGCPGAALPHRVLAAPQRPVGAPVRAAVVGHEDDHGVAVLVRPPQRRRHVGDLDTSIIKSTKRTVNKFAKLADRLVQS